MVIWKYLVVLYVALSVGLAFLWVAGMNESTASTILVLFAVLAG